MDIIKCHGIYIDKEGSLKVSSNNVIAKEDGIKILGNDINKSNTLTLNVKATELDEVKNIIASFIFMLEDTRIDRDIRLQYLESCKELKDYYVRIDK